jgi:hypothetical protein
VLVLDKRTDDHHFGRLLRQLQMTAPKITGIFGQANVTAFLGGKSIVVLVIVN